MRKVKCAACGLVNLETFPAFPSCEACGARLLQGKRRPLFDWVQRPVKTLVWAVSVGAVVSSFALLSVGISRETRLRDRGVLLISSSLVPDGRGALRLTMRVATPDTIDREPIHNLRLRFNRVDALGAGVKIASPAPSSVEDLAGGRYFVWQEFAPREMITVLLRPRRALKMGLTADGFERFEVRLSPVKKDAPAG